MHLLQETLHSLLLICFSHYSGSLSLDDNQISDDGCKMTVTALLTNKTPTRFTLYNNHISDDGCKAIATALLTNKTLTILNLGYKQITDEGCIVIATALLTNKALPQLGLSFNNQLSNVSASTFAEMLKVNSTLKTLDLDGTSISGTGQAHWPLPLGRP